MGRQTYFVMIYLLVSPVLQSDSKKIEKLLFGVSNSNHIVHCFIIILTCSISFQYFSEIQSSGEKSPEDGS